MKKSSNAVENPKMNENRLNHNAKIAHPWNKFFIFLMFFLFWISFSSISKYRGIGSVTFCDVSNLE